MGDEIRTDKPEAQAVRDSGQVEGVRGNREVPPAPSTEPDEVETLQRERDELVDTLQLLHELLPVLDDLERALEAAEAHEEAKLEEGVALVARSLADTLRKEGLEEVQTEGKFDPHVHEALLSQPSEAEEGAVVEVIQTGYRLGDRVLRPARVVIAAPKAPLEDA